MHRSINSIEILIFILSGAPFTYEATNIFDRAYPTHDDLCDDPLFPDNLDAFVSNSEAPDDSSETILHKAFRTSLNRMGNDGLERVALDFLNSENVTPWAERARGF